MPELTQEQKFKIRNRESWFKMIIFSGFSLVAIIKIINLPVSISSLTFTDILSLFLALFSIGISAAFYFKATDTSNEFYNNINKFTQYMIEKITNIEAHTGSNGNSSSTSQESEKVLQTIQQESSGNH